MFCPKCGQQIAMDSVYCNVCGTRLGAPVAQPGQGAPIAAQPASPLIALNSFPPATINSAKIAMFSVRGLAIAMEMDEVWGETSFQYARQDIMFADCVKIFEVMRQLTKGMLIQFQADGKPVVPLYRMKKIAANDWWKRIEIEVEGAGGKWFTYQDKNVMYTDYNILLGMMQNMMQNIPRI